MRPSLLRWVRTVSLALSACTASAFATAGTPAPPSIRYALAAWATQQSGDVLAIAQDLDGYLWLGTQDGLVRFDGTRFQPWSQRGNALPARSVPALASSSEGGVWVALNGGGGVARIDRGGITHYSPADGAASNGNGLLEDRQGRVWAWTDRG